MFDVKMLKKAGFEVSKKRRYSLPVIELTLKLTNGSVSKMFILENSNLYTAQTVLKEDEKIDYVKEKEIKNIEDLFNDFSDSFPFKEIREIKSNYLKNKEV